MQPKICDQWNFMTGSRISGLFFITIDWRILICFPWPNWEFFMVFFGRGEETNWQNSQIYSNDFLTNELPWCFSSDQITQSSVFSSKPTDRFCNFFSDQLIKWVVSFPRLINDSHDIFSHDRLTNWDFFTAINWLISCVYFFCITHRQNLRFSQNGCVSLFSDSDKKTV